MKTIVALAVTLIMIAVPAQADDRDNMVEGAASLYIYRTNCAELTDLGLAFIRSAIEKYGVDAISSAVMRLEAKITHVPNGFLCSQVRPGLKKAGLVTK